MSGSGWQEMHEGGYVLLAKGCVKQCSYLEKRYESHESKFKSTSE